MAPFAAVILAGGAARRMNGVDKATLPVAGRAMLHRVLAAVDAADPCVVVGPGGLATSDTVRRTREDPPGGGPVAATGAGLALLDPAPEFVALLAADLPLLTTGAVLALYDAVLASTCDGAVYVDEKGRRQLLCGVWRVLPLQAALTGLAARRADGLSGASMRALFDGLAVTEVSWRRPGAPPWFDCDTDADVRRAEEWAR
jgi:molybdopterin-guanine dinucleotide biosynthesis protein A